MRKLMKHDSKEFKKLAKSVIKDYIAMISIHEIVAKHKITIKLLNDIRKEFKIKSRIIPKITASLTKKVIKDYLAGIPVAEICKNHNINSAHIFQIRIKNNIPVRGRMRNGIKHEQFYKDIIRDYQDGYTVSILSEIYPFNKTSILKILNKHGFDTSRKIISARTRFYNKIKKTESCWEWTARKNTKGYGQFVVDGVSWLAHRYAWFMHNGSIPDGMFICHKCDNSQCCRISHLFLGTANDNVQDKIIKGKQPVGSKTGQAKLTEEEALHIKHSKERNIDLANNFNINDSTVCQIKKGYSWKHLNVIGNDK